MLDVSLTGIAAALGIGLIIGAERERAHGGVDAAAGVRTFALVALLGALATLYESTLTLLTFGLIVAGFAAIAYRKLDAYGPGLTTEVALILTYVLGALAMSKTTLAAGLAVLVTILLASRSRLHDFVRNRLTAQEVNDGLLLAASALIVLPLLPDRPVDPWGVLNLRLIFMLAVLFMAINALGYVALRAFGASTGLPLAGFLSGFVSSAATHSAMGERARATPVMARTAVAGAALSSIATVVKLGLLLAVTSIPLLRALFWPLVLSGAIAVAYAATFMWRAAHHEVGDKSDAGRAFRLTSALSFALVMGVVIAGSALLVRWIGPQGAVLGAGIAGFTTVHAGALSAGSLLRVADINLHTAVIAVLVAFTTNAASKVGLAAWSGGARFAFRLGPSLALMVAAAWGGLLL